MIVVFVIDSTASMNQKCFNGLTLLDCAKSAVEHVTKTRSRDPSSRNDRYLLVTSDEKVKVGWKDNSGSLIEIVKGIEASGLSNISSCIARAFELLNRYRFQSAIDNFGQGLCPWFSCNEPGMVMVLSDGDPTMTEMSAPVSTMPGADLMSEFWRWDQRLFSFVIALPGICSSSHTPNAPPALRSIAERTGGKCSVTTSLRQLLHAVESSVLKQALAGPFVVVNFLTRQQSSEHDELRSLEQASGASSERRLLLVRNNHGHWPIPEAHLPEAGCTSLLARAGNPTVIVIRADGDVRIPEGFGTIDKYELDQGGLSQALLAARPGTCWECYVKNSLGDGSLGNPFGFLKAEKGQCVLHVLPYNYAVLFDLFQQLTAMNGNPSSPWTSQLRKYAWNLPIYYLRHLRDALRRYQPTSGLDFVRLIQKAGDLSPLVSAYLTKLKNQTRHDNERTESEASANKKNSKAAELSKASNLFDVPRNCLLARAAELRHTVCFGAPTVAEDKFCVPVGKMGLFQESLAKQEVIRDPLLDDRENKLAQQPTFGNPFKRKDTHKGEIDQEAFGEAAAFGAGRDEKEKGGPSNPRGKRSRPSSPSPSASPKRARESDKTPPPPPPAGAGAAGGSNPAPPPVGGPRPPPARPPARAVVPTRTPPPPTPPPQRTPPPPRKSPSNEKKPPAPTKPSKPAKPPPRAPPPQQADNKVAPPAKPGAPKPAPPRPAPPARPAAPPPPSRPAPPVPPPSRAAGTPPNSPPELELKMFAVQQMRKPDKDHGALMKRLAEFKGSSKTKQAMIADLIQQARSYKKDLLVELLGAELEKM